MGVTIHEPRSDQRLAVVDHPSTGAHQLPDGSAVSHLENPITGNGHRTGAWSRRVSGPDSAIHHEIRGARLGRSGLARDNAGHCYERHPATLRSNHRVDAFQGSLVSRRMASSFSRALPPEAAGATEKRSRMS